MFNNINDSNKDFLYSSQLEKQNNIVKLAFNKMNNAKSAYTNNNNSYVDRSEISSSAIELFQRDCDINKFNKIALNQQDDNSYIERMQDLFADGVIDPFEEDVISELVTNSKLWDDLTQ